MAIGKCDYNSLCTLLKPIPKSVEACNIPKSKFLEMLLEASSTVLAGKVDIRYEEHWFQNSLSELGANSFDIVRILNLLEQNIADEIGAGFESVEWFEPLLTEPIGKVVDIMCDSCAEMDLVNVDGRKRQLRKSEVAIKEKMPRRESRLNPEMSVKTYRQGIIGRCITLFCMESKGSFLCHYYYFIVSQVVSIQSMVCSIHVYCCDQLTRYNICMYFYIVHVGTCMFKWHSHISNLFSNLKLLFVSVSPMKQYLVLEPCKPQSPPLSLRESWSVPTGRCVDSSPLVVISEEGNKGRHLLSTVYVGSHSGLVLAVELGEGSVQWRTQLPGRIESSPCLSLSGCQIVIGNNYYWSIDE